MEEEELGLDDRFEVEEGGPAACVADEIGRQASIEALYWALILYEGSEDSEGVDWSCGCVSLDWECLALVEKRMEGRYFEVGF